MSPELKELLPAISVSLSAMALISTWIMFGYMRRIDTRKAYEQHVKEVNAKADERHREVLKDIELLEEKLGKRVSDLEREMEGAMGREELDKLYNKINHWAEQTARINGELSEISTSLRSLMNRIIDKGLS